MTCTVVGSKSEYGCVFATVISLVLVYSAESSNLEVPQNNFFVHCLQVMTLLVLIISWPRISNLTWL